MDEKLACRTCSSCSGESAGRSSALGEPQAPDSPSLAGKMAAKLAERPAILKVEASTEIPSRLVTLLAFCSPNAEVGLRLS